MKEGRPSQTSAMVAAIRALADRGQTTVPGFRDPTAAQLLPPGWTRVVRFVEWRLPRMSEPQRRRALGRLDAMPLRTLAIDAEIQDALARGCRQLVVLGAGLDGRAHRMAELAGVTVFEVDHPSTQAYKQARASRLPVRAGKLVYVPVDFERDELGIALAAAGHDPAAPTIWVWEGVTMYLTDEALRKTLAALVGRSARGSTLAVQYGEPDAVRRRGVVLKTLLRIWSEPQIGARSRETMRTELERAGLRVVSDAGGPDWARRFGAAAPVGDASHTRLAVAMKD